MIEVQVEATNLETLVVEEKAKATYVESEAEANKNSSLPVSVRD